MNEDALTIYIGNNFGTLPTEDEEKLRHFSERRINLCLIQINWPNLGLPKLKKYKWDIAFKEANNYWHKQSQDFSQGDAVCKFSFSNQKHRME